LIEGLTGEYARIDLTGYAALLGQSHLAKMKEWKQIAAVR
jgi:hypothetical protein